MGRANRDDGAIMLSSRRFSLQGWQKIAGRKSNAATGTSPTREPTLKGLQTTRHSKSSVSSDTAFEGKAIGIMIRNRKLKTIQTPAART